MGEAPRALPPRLRRLAFNRYHALRPGECIPAKATHGCPGKETKTQKATRVQRPHLTMPSSSKTNGGN
eukprot:scaffold110125_cov35-Tisochrysis_lutea.AAC.3